MARKTASRKTRRRTYRPGMNLPIVRQPVPKDPPACVPLPPARRRIQRTYKKPSGTEISVVAADYFQSTYGTDQYLTCIVQVVKVWSASSPSTAATLVVKPGSPSGGTVPNHEIDDTSAVGLCARVGYALRGPFRVPWSKPATIAKLSTDQWPVTVELTALFF